MRYGSGDIQKWKREHNNFWDKIHYGSKSWKMLNAMLYVNDCMLKLHEVLVKGVFVWG